VCKLGLRSRSREARWYVGDCIFRSLCNILLSKAWACLLLCLLSYLANSVGASLSVQCRLISYHLAVHEPPCLHTSHNLLNMFTSEVFQPTNTSTTMKRPCVDISHLIVPISTALTRNPSRLFNSLAKHILQHLPKHLPPPITSHILIHHRETDLLPQTLEKACILHHRETDATSLSFVTMIVYHGIDLEVIVYTGCFFSADFVLFLVFLIPFLHIGIVGASLVFVNDYC